MTLEIEQTVRQANLITRDAQLDQLFGENVSDLLLQEVLARTEGRMTDTSPSKQETIDTESVEATTKAPRARLRVGTAMAVFAVVIAAAIGIAVIAGDQTANSPVRIVETYQDALADYDAESALPLLDPETMVTSWGLPLDQLTDELAWFEAVGWVETSTGCSEVPGGPRTHVHCTHTFENAWTRALGVGPYSGYSDYFIEDGLIVEIDGDDDPGNTFSSDAWEVFSTWVAVNHGTDHNTMYQGAEGGISFTPEAIVLWKQYTEEFVAEQQG